MPVYEVHVRPSWNPLRAIQAPVTEVDFYKTTDEEVDPEAKPAAETQEMIRRAIHYIDSLQAPGFVAISWDIALEDRRRGVTLAGWRSVEVCFFCQTFRSTRVEQFFIYSSSPFFSFDRTTCVWVHRTKTRNMWKRSKRFSVISPSSQSRTYISNRITRCPPFEKRAAPWMDGTAPLYLVITSLWDLSFQFLITYNAVIFCSFMHLVFVSVILPTLSRGEATEIVYSCLLC
jgi:hypothetical protein